MGDDVKRKREERNLHTEKRRYEMRTRSENMERSPDCMYPVGLVWEQ